MDQSEIIMGIDIGKGADFSKSVVMKRNSSGKMEIVNAQDDIIIEVDQEEVTDEQLKLERIIKGFKPHLNRPVPNPGNKNMTWEEFEQLYNELYQQENE